MCKQLTSRRSSGHRLRIGLFGLCVAAAAMTGCASKGIPTPLQASLVPNAQLFPEDVQVTGVSVNAIYGVQQNVKGGDLGLFNEVGELSGIGAGLINVAREDVSGFQCGVANSVGGSLSGMQVGTANQISSDLVGVQVGLGNASGGGSGLQIGFINHTKSMKGLQIGFININENGFLPFFPVFNFAF